MKQLVLFFFVSLSNLFVFAQQEKKAIYTGNQLYQQQKYPEAEQYYRQSVEKSQASIEGNFNLGDAFYKQKKYDDAAKKFTDIATSANNKAIKAQAYHNLGNTLLESKKLEESIAAYKKSLINNPKDNETRYNLAYAQEMLKQQQQKKDNKDNDKNNKQNKDKQDQDKKNQQDKDKQDQEKNNKGQQNKDEQQGDNKDQQRPNDDQQKKDEEQQKEQQQPGKLSKDDAERMLEALNHEEKNTQDKLKNKKAKGVKGRITKDW